MPTGAKSTKVLYIASWGRSGSTVLDNVLGQAPGFFSVAEIYQLWNYGLKENGICGCGLPIKQCPIWSSVLTRVYGSVADAAPEEMIRWRDRYVRTRLIPFVDLLTRGIIKPESAGLMRLNKLYSAIAEETGCDVIIDSSKHPIYGSLVALLPSVELYVLHLVRHPCAVAYSWQRKKKMPDLNRYFRVRRPIETSIYWTVWNLGIQALGRSLQGRYLRVRYEDFVTDPRKALASIYRLLGVKPDDLPIDVNNEFAMNTNHTVIGNPVKFARGRIKIRSDNEWETRFPASSRYITTMAAWPLMLHYGYRPNKTICAE